MPTRHRHGSGSIECRRGLRFDCAINQSQATIPSEMPRAMASGRFKAPNLHLILRKWKLTVRSATHSRSPMSALVSPRAAISRQSRSRNVNLRPSWRRGTTAPSRARICSCNAMAISSRSPRLVAMASRRAVLTGSTAESKVTVTHRAGLSCSDITTPLAMRCCRASSRNRRTRQSRPYSPASHRNGAM